jgi:dCTP deaminase
MILTQKEILKEIEQQRIRIIPFERKNVGPASVDLRLSNRIRIFTHHTLVHARERTKFEDITTARTFKSYMLRPGELVLGMTEEKITLPDDICGWLNSRSRFARLGLMVHITAPFMQPGIENHQVLEIYNAAPHNLMLYAGEKLCQFVFQRCEGKAKYKGRFRNQVI